MPSASALSEKDARLIKRCCVCPQLALVSLVMPFVLGVLFILGEMIGDLVFYGEGNLRFLGMNVYFAFAIAFMIVFCYCALMPKFGMSSKRWVALTEQLRVRQTEEDRSAEIAGALALSAAGRLLSDSDNEAAQDLGGLASVAGAAATAAVAAEQLAEISGNAEAVAEAYGVTVPDTKRALIAMVAASVLVTAAAYGARYLSASESMQKSQVAASAQVELLTSAFEEAGLATATVGNPAEKYRDEGYTVYGFLSGDYWSHDGGEVSIDLDKNGLVTDVWYSERVDIKKSLEDNLAQAQQDFSKLGKALSASNARAKTEALLTQHEFSEEFCQQFSAGDIYTEIWLSDRTEDYYIYYFFNTEEQDAFNENTQPEIQLDIKAR
ncbi:MAG: hypothetical protein Q4B45_06980 [Coriobacteriia bacterium]|nr:hypothetical protein [Coriobacteriia bacterium]